MDTHPIHVHLYEVQVLNRVGWDGIIRKPDANELGGKDTLRVSPLEDTIVALWPIVPHLPAAWNGLPNSIRLLDPALAEGEYLHHANTTAQEALGLPIYAFNPDGEPVDIINHYVNFGWEYVYHCHILSHEEMDMMHPQVVGIAPAAPGSVSAVRAGNGQSQRYDLTWTPVTQPGFGISHDIAPPSILDLTVFSGRLYASTGRGDGPAQIWRTLNRVTWAPMVITGFSDPDTVDITAFAEYDGMLYAGALT